MSLLSIFYIFFTPQPFVSCRAPPFPCTVNIAYHYPSGRKSKSMVLPWRSSLYSRCFGHGGSHDTGARIPLLRLGPEEVRSDDDLGYHGLVLCHHISMVLLGLFAGIFSTGDERLYWRSEAFWLDQYPWRSKSRVPADSGAAVRFLSGTRSACSSSALVYADIPLQLQFCATTAAITAGAVAERGRVVPMMVFLFCWATIVYCPIAYWGWNINGWGFKYGVMDYAGGGPVEIGSGMSALAYSLVLGKRQEKMMANFRPHNVSLIVLGTVFLWFGWLGFNGGSSFGANLRAVQACWNTNLTAMFGAASWTLLDWRLARKWSMVGWCSGAISGLVAATPASGYCTPWGSIILGVVTGVTCNYATKRTLTRNLAVSPF